MRTIELRTRNGGFVAFVEIAPFPDAGMPDVVIWGERVFVKASDRARAPMVYEEAFAVVSLTPSPGITAAAV